MLSIAGSFNVCTVDIQGGDELLVESPRLPRCVSVPLQERKEGSFDASGMYVPKKFEQIRDAWLMSGDADPNEVWKLREAKEAKERQEKAEREAELALDKLENRHLLQIVCLC